ncbi:uncharacterized protein LOC144662558 [Oculina patagonica]
MLRHCLEKMLLLLYFASVFSVCEASEYKFSLSRTSDWQFVGRRVKYTLTMTIPESTAELKTKIKLPVNGTAILRLTEAKITDVSKQLTFTNNATNMTSSADDGLIDIAFFDFGTVTRGAFAGDTEIKIEFQVQVMNHDHVVNGGLQWVSVATQYGTNQSVWAAMLAVKTVYTACKRPDLKVDFRGVPPVGHSVLFGEQISLRLVVSQSPLTTDLVESGTVQLPLPSFLTYHSHTTSTDSVSVVVSDTGSTVSIQFGTLEFPQKVDVMITLSLDPDKTRADGKIHDCTTHVNLKYIGPADTCTSSSGSREFAHEGPATASFKYYVKQDSCEEPSGIEDGSITDAQITASSYSPGGEPHKARLNGDQAWIPNGPLSKERTQFLQVNFTSVVKIRRISTQGKGNAFVTRFSLYYSYDGVIWKSYKEGSKPKEFAANTNADSAQMIALPIPIEAVFIRLNPTGWHKNIALRVEFYGCVLSQQPQTSGALLKFTGRGYLLDKDTGTMYVCSVPMKSKKSAANCYFSRDQGDTWTDMDNRLLVILGHETTENTIFGVSRNGKSILKSTEDHSARFVVAPQNEWLDAKEKATTTLTKWLESDLAIANTTMTPQSWHTVTSTSGITWGASANGIHVELESEWKLKAIWTCNALGK